MSVGTPVLAGAVERTKLVAWYREMGAGQKRTFWTCYGGHALDAMDTQLYSWVVPSLLGLWGLSRAEVGEIGTAALLASALGGWGAGLLADRIGRETRGRQLSAAA
jgi:MFS family permease